MDARRVAGLARRLEREAAMQLRREMKKAEHATDGAGAAKKSDDEEIEADPKALVIKLLVEAMTGRKIKVVSLDEMREAQSNAEAAASRASAGGPAGRAAAAGRLGR